jgi:hypothetical protein
MYEGTSADPIVDLIVDGIFHSYHGTLMVGRIEHWRRKNQKTNQVNGRPKLEDFTFNRVGSLRSLLASLPKCASYDTILYTPPHHRNITSDNILQRQEGGQFTS